MKLGISINLFDGVELLKFQLRLLRPHVEHIHVMYQDISNFGKKLKDSSKYELAALKKRGLIDVFHCHEPDISKGAQWNEYTKRNLGLLVSIESGMTHHMSLDCDEFYTPVAMQNLRHTMEEGNYDSSCCKLVSYWKEPIYQLDTWDRHYVPLIYKIRDVNGQKNHYNTMFKFPELVDPTRIMDPGACKVFNAQDIFCHHFSYVRKDIRIKYENSTSSINFKDRIDELVEQFNSWEFGKPAILPGFEKNIEMDVRQVKNIFKIDIHG